MTREELDERIYAAIHDGVILGIDEGQAYLRFTDEAEDLIRQLIRDRIEAVTPGEFVKKYIDSTDEYDHLIEANTKELLG